MSSLCARAAVSATSVVFALFLMSLPFESSAAAQSISPATSLVWQLSNQITTVTQVWELTPTTDPDQLLGLPGQYFAKTLFADSQVTLNSGYTGSIEVFSDTRALTRRQAYLKQYNPADYVVADPRSPSHATVLLRIPAAIDPLLLRQYDGAFLGLVLP